MKTLFYIFFTALLISCSQAPSKHLVAEDLKYSAYRFYTNPQTDNWDFYLAHYINISENGHFVAMRHDSFMDDPKYYEGEISDEVIKLIDSKLHEVHFRADYSWKDEDAFIYDGFTYCIDYKNINTYDRNKIQFIPNNSPEQIKSLVPVFDSLFFKANIKVSKINLDEYSEQLKQLYISVNGPLIKAKKVAPIVLPSDK